MTKKIGLGIVIGLIAAVVLITGYFIFMFFGNPISKMLAIRSAHSYCEKQYGKDGFRVEKVGYDFKNGEYYAYIIKPDSMDIHFFAEISLMGKVKRDNYEKEVLGGWNTARRINEDYQKLVRAVLVEEEFPHKIDFAYGMIEFSSKDFVAGDNRFHGLITEDLTVDKIYDVKKIGGEVGKLVVYIEDTNLTSQKAAKILLDIKKLMDREKIPFRSIDLHIHPPREEESVIEEEFSILNLPVTEIYEDGMLERVKLAEEETKKYYQKLDEEKERELSEFSKE